MCSLKKVFLQISQNSQETTVTESLFLIKLQAEACNFIRKENLAQMFSWNFATFLRTTFLYKTPSVAASEKKNIFMKILFEVFLAMTQLKILETLSQPS